MSATPVGHLYTPQQLMGSVKYGSGVLLGNWREDDALDDMRMADYIELKEEGSLCLLKRQSKLAPQLLSMKLSAAPADGIMRYGDEIMMQSCNNGGTLAVSLGQQLVCTDEASLKAVYACRSDAPIARNVIRVTRCAVHGPRARRGPRAGGLHTARATLASAALPPPPLLRPAPPDPRPTPARPPAASTASRPARRCATARRSPSSSPTASACAATSRRGRRAARSCRRSW